MRHLIGLAALVGLVGCGAEAQTPEEGHTEALHFQPRTAQVPRIAQGLAAPRVFRLPAFNTDPTLTLLDAGCPIQTLYVDDLDRCAGGWCLDGHPVQAQAEGDGRIVALNIVEATGRRQLEWQVDGLNMAFTDVLLADEARVAEHTIRCTGDDENLRQINEIWLDVPTRTSRQRITSLREWDAFGVASGLTEDITVDRTQVARFDIARDDQGGVTQTRRRLFPSRGDGLCQDELRTYEGGEFELSTFACMAGW